MIRDMRLKGAWFGCQIFRINDTNVCFSFAITARNLLQFGDMVNCMTNKSRFSYIDYGCWCGWGGKGEPVDEVDKYVIIRL